MSLSRQMRAFLSAAHTLKFPFAIWSRPGSSETEALISCSGLEKRHVFEEGNNATAQPFFALNSFTPDTPNIADAIPGDIRLQDNQAGFWNGERYTDKPDSASQKAFLDAVSTDGPPSPIQADNEATPPCQTDETTYRSIVKKAVQAMERGEFRKVVSSRVVKRKLADDHDLLSLFEALSLKLPAAFVCLVSLPGQGAWLVGTPETLLSVRNDQLETMALAGTQWADTDGAEKEIDLRAVTWPDKIIEEQALVCQYIRQVFENSGVKDYRELGPQTVRAANLVHLRSEFAVDISGHDASLPAAILNAIQPTSAVCGLPKQPALEFLAQHEGYQRGYYTGYLGPVNVDGTTHLFVNLRTAQIIGANAYLYVGGGLVSSSDPELEWQETVEKTKTVGSVLA